MSVELSYGQYWAEIRAIAAGIRGDVPHRDHYDAVHERVDGHEWVIYTHWHHKILALVEPDDDDSGWCTLDGGWDALVTRAAYSAMVRDVLGALDEDDENENDEDEDG